MLRATLFLLTESMVCHKKFFSQFLLTQHSKLYVTNYSKLTLIQHLLGFAANLERFSQLNGIIECMKKQPSDLNAALLF